MIDFLVFAFNFLWRSSVGMIIAAVVYGVIFCVSRLFAEVCKYIYHSFIHVPLEHRDRKHYSYTNCIDKRQNHIIGGRR